VTDSELISEPVSSPGCPPPHPAPTRPSVSLPAGACDTHCHVFGPRQRFPYAADRTFTPVDVPKEQLRDLHAFLGLTRAVIVQSSCHGTDHSVLVDALATSGGRWRGVGLIDARTPPERIAELHAAGVRGFRLNFLPHLPAAAALDELAPVLAVAADHGWHAAVHVHGDGILRYRTLIESLPVTVVIDHLGRVDLSGGPAGAGVDQLRRMLDAGVWVKVSGIDRVSRLGPPYADAVDLAALLVAHAPEKVLWGTDFPHPNITGPAPDDGLLVEALARIAPTPALRARLLVDNPTTFYDFPASSVHAPAAQRSTE
jgi:predicted TIM-barrel fold metal-dependent hydrolase